MSDQFGFFGGEQPPRECCSHTGYPHPEGVCSYPGCTGTCQPRPEGLSTGPDFDGPTYERPPDHGRMTGQLKAVYDVMADRQWHTLDQLQAELHAKGHIVTQTAISARIRDLRKTKFGQYPIETDRVEGGLFRYRLTGARGEGVPEIRGHDGEALETADEIVGMYAQHRRFCPAIVTRDPCTCGLDDLRRQFWKARGR